MKLLEEIQLGRHTLRNRMVMAAMTRCRADADGIVGELTVEYYTQRASAGLILTEAINISKQAQGSPFTPGLYTSEHIEAWRKVTDAVHSKGGLIYAQLWHTGRVGHSVDKQGALPVAPSAIAISGRHYTSQGPKEYETPHALTVEEIKQIISDYHQAALNAIEAGFDGVELHGANGYLPNQFLAESANQRTDEYGGSIENNCRFVTEVMNTLVSAVGGDRVGIKLSPFHPYGDTFHTDPVATFTFLFEELNKLDIAFIELMKRSPMFPSPESYPAEDEVDVFGPLTRHTLIANCGYTRDTAEAELERGIAKLISFGSLFLANPDLPARFALNAPLNTPDRATLFQGGAVGYTDYPEYS